MAIARGRKRYHRLAGVEDISPAEIEARYQRRLAELKQMRGVQGDRV